jgi:hypothetical protein
VVELSSVLRTRKVLILGTATRAKKAPLPDPLYVYCTKMLRLWSPADPHNDHSIPQICRAGSRKTLSLLRHRKGARVKLCCKSLGPFTGRGFCNPDLLYLSLLFCVRLVPFVAIGGCAFAIIDAEVRNASTVTPIALRRVFEARHRA